LLPSKARNWFKNRLQRLIQHFDQHFKQLIKPSGNHHLASGTLTDFARSRHALGAENTLLCQQLIVLNRQIDRPKLNQKDRLFMVILAGLTTVCVNDFETTS